MIRLFTVKNKDKISYSIGYLMFLLLFLPYFGNTQILNLENYRIDGDSLKKYAVNFNGAFNTNNRSAAEDSPVNLLGFNFSLHGIYQPKKHGYIFITHRNFLQINNSPFINFGFIHTRVNFLRKNQLNYEVFLQLSDDNFRGLKPRGIVGGGLRYRIIDTDTTDLILGVGGIYEYENWTHPLNETIYITQFVKSSLNLLFRYSASEKVYIKSVIYHQTGFDQTIKRFRNRYNGTFTVNTKITKRLSFTNHFDFSYEDRPIVPITKFIFSYRFGIGIDF